MIRLGVVSFLNARPLFDSLIGLPDIELTYAVPSALEELLLAGKVDVALLPVIDFLRHGERLRAVSDAGIACDGETLTVRVFLRKPPERIETLAADTDSHTSIALARVLWANLFHRRLEIRGLAPGRSAADCDAVLLIGDKVVASPQSGFAEFLDLGRLWKSWTGLPFVFATWVAGRDVDCGQLAARLSAARDDGLARIDDIARRTGPELGWPVELAKLYLGQKLKYVLGPEFRRGMQRFFELVQEAGHGGPEVAEPVSTVT